MEKYIQTLIQSFNGKNYKDFIQYVYFSFEGKKDKQVDKYKKIRQSVLNYIIANEKAIVAELKKKNSK